MLQVTWFCLGLININRILVAWLPLSGRRTGSYYLRRLVRLLRIVLLLVVACFVSVAARLGDYVLRWDLRSSVVRMLAGRRLVRGRWRGRCSVIYEDFQKRFLFIVYRLLHYLYQKYLT